MWFYILAFGMCNKVCDKYRKLHDFNPYDEVAVKNLHENFVNMMKSTYFITCDNRKLYYQIELVYLSQWLTGFTSEVF